MPLPAVHLALAWETLERWRTDPPHAPFDPTAAVPRNAFLQGALGPDMGFFPGGVAILSELAHNHRPGDLTRALAASAGTDVQRAFVWGWLTHVLADVAVHPTVNEHARRAVVAAGGDPADEQALAAAHSRLELGLDIRLHARDPRLRRIRLAHAFDARSVGWVADAYRQTYGLSFRCDWVLRSHRAVAPLARALALLECLHLHAARSAPAASAAPSAPRSHRPARFGRGALCMVGAALGRYLSAGNRAFLQPLAPPRALLRCYQDTAAAFWSLLRRYQVEGLRSLGNPDLDGRAEPLRLSA